MQFQVVETKDAPTPVGPYSQGIQPLKPGFPVYFSGQIPLEPATSQTVQGSVGEQVTRVIDNIEALLKSHGLGLNDVLKTTIFLKDMNDFAKVNDIYGKRFGAHRPARSTVEVARLPRDVKVEIEIVAWKES